MRRSGPGKWLKLCYLRSFHQSIEQWRKRGLALVEDHSEQRNTRRFELFPCFQQQMGRDASGFQDKNRSVACTTNRKC